MFDDWLTPVQWVELIIVLTLLEGFAIALHHKLTGRGLAPRSYALNLVAGLCLMMALRASVQDSGWLQINLFLVLAGIAHGLDLWRRWT